MCTRQTLFKSLKAVGRDTMIILLLTFLLITQACTSLSGRTITQSYLKQHPNIIRHYSKEEINELNKRLKETPEIYKEQLLNFYLNLIANKNTNLVQEIAKLPFLNNGITLKGVETLKQFYEIIKDFNFPEAFGKGELCVSGSRELFVYASHKDELRILKVLDYAVRAGAGEYRYSSMLEALMWMIEDNETDKLITLLKNYEGMMPFIIEAWGKMEGIRWIEYKDVIKRLNHPLLCVYYVKCNFTFQSDKKRESQDSKQTFERRGGVCRHYATFVTDALFKAGLDIKNLTVIWGNDGHTVSVVRDNNSKYWVVMDSERPGNIMGPYNSYDEIAGKISRGRFITRIYIENNFELYDRNKRAFGR